MMDNWVSKMGFPLLTVTEKDGSIHVRQDRFLETGPAAEKDNQTLWYVPARAYLICTWNVTILLGKFPWTLRLSEPMGSLKSTPPSWKIRRSPFLWIQASRSNWIMIQLVSVSDCTHLSLGDPFHWDILSDRVLYSPERLDKIGAEAAKKDSSFTMNDRMGLVNDIFALSNAGFGKVSAALALIQNLRQEEECKTQRFFFVFPNWPGFSPCMAGHSGQYERSRIDILGEWGGLGAAE